MAFHIQKTNRITKETVYFNNDTTWTTDYSIRYVFNTIEDANGKNAQLQSRGYSGTVITE